LTKDGNGIWKGSGRSIEAFSLIDNLHEIKDTLNHFGGHDMACGVGVKEGDVDRFRQAMIKRANLTLTEDDYIPTVTIDVTIGSHEVTETLVDELDQLKPFGTQFEEPNISVTDFEVDKVFNMGKDRSHLKLSNDQLSIIMWGGSDFYEEVGQPLNIRVIGNPSLNHFRGKTTPQVIVKDKLLKAI